MIAQIQKYGKAGPHGQVEVSFGKLFEETAQIFDALSGILKTCKKCAAALFLRSPGQPLTQHAHQVRRGGIRW